MSKLWFLGMALATGLIVATACSSSSTPPPAASAAAPATSKPAPTTSAAPPSTTQAAPAKPVNGEELYQRTASGVGCAGCHGTDAYGNVGPNIRGATAQEIKDAIKDKASMTFIKMTDTEIDAVAGYLKNIK